MTMIAEGKVVSIQYTLRNEAGDVLDSSPAENPLHYLHGADNIVPGLESQLAGRAEGDACEAVVPPEEGYGEREESEPQPVPKTSFPEEMPLKPGIGFAVQGEDGNPVHLWVVRVEGEQVLVDVNHPLAGETLHFDVKVLAIRDATEEELQHGHPHGATGHEGHSH